MIPAGGPAAFKQPESVLVVIHTAAGDVLLLERARDAGLWQSVTGSREGTETPRETARREVGEETGLAIDADALIDHGLANRFPILPRWHARYAPGVTHNREHLFSLELPARRDVRLAPDEHRAQRWLPWEAAAREAFSWTNRDGIRLVGRRLAARR